MPPEVWTPLAASSSIGRDQTRKLRVRLRPTANPERPNQTTTVQLPGTKSLLLYWAHPPNALPLQSAPSSCTTGYPPTSPPSCALPPENPRQSCKSWIRQRPHNLAHTPFFVFDVTLLQCYTRGCFTVDRFPPFYSGSSPFLNQVVQCATTRISERKDFPTHNGRGLP